MAPPGARLAEINDPPLSLVTGSVVWVEGEIGQWPLILPGNLPSWPSAGVLSNNVVQVVVDDRGQVLSTVLLESSGLLAADNLALDLAGSARFQTPRSDAVVSSQEKWGKIVFSWQTTDPNPKVATAPAKSP
jgi:hypothetical protein